MDIPLLPPQRRTAVNTMRIKEEFVKRVARGDKHPLLFAMNAAFFKEFWFSGGCRLYTDTVSVLSPLLLKYLIQFATDAYYGKHPHIGKGIGLAVGITVLQMSSSVAMNQFIYRGMIIGGLSRASLISLIFAKSQTISSRAKAEGSTMNKEDKAIKKAQAKQDKKKNVKAGIDDQPGYTNGKVVNLMGTDTYRVDTAAAWCHILWTAPVQIVIVLVLLLVNLGVSALAGFGLLVITTPFITIMIKTLAKRRLLMNKITDKRVSLTQEILQGVRFVKYFAWEQSFLEHLNKLRKREIRAIQFLLAVRSAVNAVSMVSSDSLLIR